MKIRLLSDLHLEHSGFDYEFQGEDLVVLAGDIVDGNGLYRLQNFIESIPVDILYIPGNHEFYHNSHEDMTRDLYTLSVEYNHFYLLCNAGFIKCDDINKKFYYFFGGTMFSDLSSFYSPNVHWNRLFDCLGDFRYTENHTPDDHDHMHKNFNNAFDTVIGKVDFYNKPAYPDYEFKKICISHFLPSEVCVHPMFKNDPLNDYFRANNDDRVKQVDLWLFGHTHCSVDTMLGNTRIVCNPRGYSKQFNLHPENPNFNRNLIIEI